MTSIEGTLIDFRRLEQLAAGDTAMHRLDPRAKVLVTVAFMVSVLSFGRYELSSLVPFFIFPAVVIGLGDLPAGYLLRKVALVSPYALTVGIFNPIFDRNVLLQLGPLPISGGVISCISILLRVVLCTSAALLLVSVTGFPSLCQALCRLGMPAPFAAQLLLLYRYLFVLVEEGGRAARARELRCFGKKGRGLAGYASLTGQLLLRSWQRAERVHMAMLGRGFSGEFRARAESRFGAAECLFLLGWCALFLALRLYNGAELLGALAMGSLP